MPKVMKDAATRKIKWGVGMKSDADCGHKAGNTPAEAVRHRLWRASRVVALSAATLLTVGCAAQVSNHGHVFTQDEIAQIRPGMSKDQVKLVLGTPDTQSSIGGDAFYYISSRHETLAFLPSKVVDRKILAVYFDEYNTTKKVVHYGLKDGKVIDMASGETPSHGRELGLIQQMFGNLGKKLSM